MIETAETGKDSLAGRPVALVLKSTITCPNCGKQSTETMPTDACRFFWDCPFCEVVLRPREGDCCVFCSYGSVPCPSVQLTGSFGTPQL